MADGKTLKSFHSCFIVDVKFRDDAVKLEDSCRNAYYVDIKDKDAIASFKSWLKNVFLKGEAQTITVFSYEIRMIDRGIPGAFITKFIAAGGKPLVDAEQSCHSEASI